MVVPSGLFSLSLGSGFGSSVVCFSWGGGVGLLLVGFVGCEGSVVGAAAMVLGNLLQLWFCEWATKNGPKIFLGKLPINPIWEVT